MSDYTPFDKPCDCQYIKEPGVERIYVMCRMHAAAPELLSALKLFDMGPRTPEGNQFGWTLSRKKYEQIKQAIAKAEGRYVPASENE